MARLTVASIARRAFDGVARRLDGVILPATLTRTTVGEYDPATGTVTATTATDSGRVVFDNERPPADIFPAYVPGPGEELAYLEGLTTLVPREADRVTAAGKVFAVIRSADLLYAGGLWPVILRADGAEVSPPLPGNVFSSEFSAEFG